ncbi:MMPL family transporter [Actinomadura rudentiformis]|uniref:MMPL family transporter n=1 Tax=Actinomadura rudentiformis TaxID=359158 RepID=A0A6H9YSH7_9ACTN|nr:MMPL family transporter [Actinomadura rudentiformis]KAB2343999.1 MMPL family transporter [Actinomadura rudentiformis]
MFAWLARVVVRHPWWTILAWLVAAAAIIMTAPAISTQEDTADFLPSKYESIQAAKIAEKAFPQRDEESALIVVKRSDGAPLTAADGAKITQVARALESRKPPVVRAFTTGPDTVAPNKAVQIIGMPMIGDDDDKMSEAVKKTREQLPAQLSGSGLDAKIGGNVASWVDNQKSFDQSFEIVGIATFVLIIGLILLIFRAPLAALLPLLVITATMQVVNGLIAFAANAFNWEVGEDLGIIMLIVLFGIGTDYILFLLFRYRERLRAGDDKKTAMIISMERVGEVIFSAAGAVAVAFLVMLLAAFGGFGPMGPALAIAVTVMAVTALTLVPAIVSLLGTAVFWPSKAWRKRPKGSQAAALGRLVGRRPAVVALVSGALLVGLAVGTFSFKSNNDFFAGFPQDTESAQANKDMQKGFPPGLTTPVSVYVKRADGQALEQGQLAAFSEKAKGVPGVGRVQQPEPSKADRSVARVDLLLKQNPLSAESIELVRGDLRDAVHKAAPPGTWAYVGGETSTFADINNVMNRDLSVILPVAAVLIALILALLLRSLVAPIYLVAVVLLGFAATLGAAVYTFQGALGEPGLTFQLPTILYLFVLAIGTDYNILLTARLREEAKEGNDPRRAAALAVEHGGPTVAAAGLILAGTFSVMMLAKVSMLQQIGFAVAIGIVLSAFVVSIFLVPAVTALLGHKAWWPGHGDEPPVRKGPDPLEEQFARSGRHAR